MRHRTFLALAAAAALAAGSLVTVTRPAAVSAAPTAADDLRSTVAVVGDGRVTVQPDLATVTFGVEATGQTLAAVQADASTRMQAVIDGLVGLGMPREDIKTSRISASPVYDQRDNTQIRGYRASNSVQVKLRELDRVGQIVDAITAAGANRVEGLAFSVEKIEEPKNQARAQAMQNARVKADQLAALAGMRITGIKAIQESDASSSPVQYAQPAAARAEGAVAAPPPIEPGTQEIRTQVTVTYIME
ncbi:MAG: SIMPL domain-containing protein [Chloroflexi bacterium]|nr:SIMPL domain-containing protein [Chloroflexota bacterium]